MKKTQETWVHSLGGASAGGNGTPLQHSCLENPMDRGARQATVHGVAKSCTRLSNLFVHETHIYSFSFLKFCVDLQCCISFRCTAK